MPNRLQKRLLTMTLFPALVFAVIFLILAGTLHATQTRQFFEQTLDHLTRTITPVFSDASADSGPVSGQVMDLVLNSPYARAARLRDAQGNILLARGPENLVDLPYRQPATPLQQQSGDWMRITVPLGTPDPETAGARWLDVDFSLAPVKLSIYRLAAISALLGGIGLVLVWLVVLRSAQRVWSPFEVLEDTVRKLAHGDLTARMPENQDVLSELSTGVNELGQSLQAAHQEMQANIDQATQDLRETLETLEIQNIELVNARRQAVEAGETKSQFLANMSHEIRTPLNGLLGFVNLLEKTRTDSRQSDYIRTIRQSAENLLAIINNILDVMKLDAGKLELEHRSLNLRDLVEDVLDILAPMSFEKPIELVAMVYDDVPANVMGDPLRLRQVLMNLASNAVKFTDSGHVVVRVAQEGEDKRHVRLRLMVSDTGQGIPADQQKKLFRAFNQADVSTSRRFGGTGLGLMICQRLVQRMGGRIEMESTENEGTTVSVLLDLEYDPEKSESTSGRFMEGARVVLHEPNDLNRLALRHNLQRWGGQVHEISSAITPSLSGILPDSPIHLAILTFDSRQVQWLIQVCTSCRKRGIPVILTTRHGEQDAELKRLEPYVQSVLTKPVRRRKLARLCTTHLNVSEVPALKRPPVRILVVDDNATNRYLIHAFLTEMGIPHDEADSGARALEKISRQRYDLVFMDLRMPGMDGITATQEIRRHEESGSHLPVIALTAHAPENDPGYWAQNGFDSFLSKPVNETQLAQAIQEWSNWPVEIPEIPSPVDRESNGTEPPPETNPIFDPTLALQRAGQRPDLAADMLDGLLAQLHTIAEDWPPMLDNGHLTSLLDAVHALHGVTLYCGTPDLERTLSRLERHLRKPDASSDLEPLLEDTLGAATQLLSECHENDWKRRLQQVG